MTIDLNTLQVGDIVEYEVAAKPHYNGKYPDEPRWDGTKDGGETGVWNRAKVTGVYTGSPSVVHITRDEWRTREWVFSKGAEEHLRLPGGSIHSSSECRCPIQRLLGPGHLPDCPCCPSPKKYSYM